MQGDHSYGTLCRALTRHSLCSHLQVFLLHVVMFPCCRELLGSPSTAAPCGSVNPTRPADCASGVACPQGMSRMLVGHAHRLTRCYVACSMYVGWWWPTVAWSWPANRRTVAVGFVVRASPYNANTRVGQLAGHVCAQYVPPHPGFTHAPDRECKL